MEAFFLGLLVLLVATVFVVFVGHGIWVFVASLFASPEAERPRRGLFGAETRCPGCKRLFVSSRPWCDHCGLERSGPVAAELVDLQAVARQLDRFWDRELLEPVVYDRLGRLVEERRRDLVDGRREPARSPQLPIPKLSTSESTTVGAPPALQAAVVIEEILEVIPVEEPRVPSVSPLVPTSSLPAPQAAPAIIQESPETSEPETTPAPRRRRSFTDLLAGFMEERNILWGEVVGGLLIVGCSIALVISLWSTLEKLPYFPFLIFSGITAALFGAGLYTLHHWKLETTSRGLLVIATLLVPLNFLTLLVPVNLLPVETPPERQPSELLRAVIELAALPVFAGFVFFTGGVLVPRGRWLVTLGVLGPCAGLLLVPRLWGGPAAPTMNLVVLGFLPVACHGASTCVLTHRLALRRRLSLASAGSLFAHLGQATFALLVALGFLVYWSADQKTALERLAVLIALAGIPILLAGLEMHRSLARSAELAAARTAGTGLALAGIGVMVLALILAWPQPLAMLPVCALNFAVLTAIAFYYELPVAHVVALPCLAVGYLLAYHLLGGHLAAISNDQLGAQLLRLGASPASGVALVPLALALVGVAELLAGRVSRSHHVSYRIGAALTTAASLLLISLPGSVESGRNAAIYAIYAAVSLALNVRWRQAAVTYLGLAIFLSGTLWGLDSVHHADWATWGWVLAVEALGLVVLSVVLGKTEPWSACCGRALRDMAAVAGVGAGAFSVFTPLFPAAAPLASTAALLAATAMLLAWSYRSVPLTWLASTLLLASLSHALLWTFNDWAVPRPWAMALLLHATVALAAGLALDALHRRRLLRTGAAGSNDDSWLRVHRILGRPLCHSALVSTAVCLPLLATVEQGQMIVFCLYTAWLAAVWLADAWFERRPWMFTAFQAALAIAVVYGTTAWLERQPWVGADYPNGLTDPRSIHSYGLALGALALLWVATRILFRSNARAQILLAPGWPSLDRLVLAGLVIGQAVLAVGSIMPSVVREITGAAATADLDMWYVYAHGPSAWMLLGLLTAVLAVSLWEKAAREVILGMVVLAVTVPVLAAGPFAEQRAVNASLRWGLAAAYLAISGLLWVREPLLRLATRAGCRCDERPKSAAVRWLLLATAVLPVLALTAVIAGMRFGGHRLLGPVPGSFFHEIGTIAGFLVPLGLIGLALVGMRCESGRQLTHLLPGWSPTPR